MIIDSVERSKPQWMQEMDKANRTRTQEETEKSPGPGTPKSGDIVDISEEGKSASKAMGASETADDGSDPEKGVNLGLGKEGEENDGPLGSESLKGLGGLGGGQEGNALKQKLEELQKKLKETEEKIQELEAQGNGRNAEELTRLKGEKERISAQMNALKQQMQSLGSLDTSGDEHSGAFPIG